MAIFKCDGCDQMIDIDWGGYNDLGDGKEYCDDCCDHVDLDELPEIPEITLITRRPVKVKPMEDL